VIAGAWPRVRGAESSALAASSALISAAISARRLSIAATSWGMSGMGRGYETQRRHGPFAAKAPSPTTPAACLSSQRWVTPRTRVALPLAECGAQNVTCRILDLPKQSRPGPARAPVSGAWSPVTAMSPTQSRGATWRADESDRARPPSPTLEIGRRHERATREGRTSPDACFLGEQERRARRSSRAPRVSRRRVLPRGSMRPVRSEPALGCVAKRS